VGILDEAIREITLEKQIAEDESRRAREDFDLITSRAIDMVQKTIAVLQVELRAANWWADELSEDIQKPEYLSLSFSIRRYSENPDPVTNPDYFYSIKFDALGGAVRTIGAIGAIDPLLEPLLFRAVARQDFKVDLENDLKLFLKAILSRH
jgi:hypothetical protein